MAVSLTTVAWFFNRPAITSRRIERVMSVSMIIEPCALRCRNGLRGLLWIESASDTDSAP